MAYLALYRAWRPQIFRDVVGQEQIVTALQNALAQNRLTHAYLFSGPRGTGKTSVAKIIAKAVNCLEPKEGEPCNECSSCKDIKQGNFMDVVEIDAASNRGIDEIRELREKVRIMPAQGNKKVYIIDEVHMLTTEAFNALLKTLEEPPESVIFILATTELQKIPATIVSRCQTYQFRRITVKEIKQRLEQVAAANGIEISPEALDLIARRSNGGLRDALSILDQIYSYQGSVIDKKHVLDVLGLVDDAFMAELIDALLANDAGKVIRLVNTALEQGKETGQIARECVVYLRELLLYLVLGEKAQEISSYQIPREILKDQKEKAQAGNLLQALRKMMDTADRLRFSEGNRFQLELGFLEIAQILSQVEKSVPSLEQTAAKPELAPAGKNSKKIEARDGLWKKILFKVKEKRIPTHALLSQGSLLGIREGILFIGYKKKYKFHKERMEEPANREILQMAIQEILGQDLQITFIFMEDEQYNDIVVKKAIEIFGEEIIELKD
ncbi:MAG: DNA polymerase III subunit gamma/tau [Syntrophomonadaceae bacterium]|jgi:DNA polymerase-3 subunit gamma/tau|nr:DNA polymerase III subunit gamma/tau [Syntrophomonadaceae bacterium]